MDYAITETFLALVLGVIITAAAAVCLLMIRTRGSCNKVVRYLLPFFFGCGVCGVDYLALSGTSFHVKMNTTLSQLHNGDILSDASDESLRPQ